MDYLKRYVVMTVDQMLVVALWIIFTWLHEKIAVHSPLLLVTSPQANSGKSTLLGVISFLARRALQSVSISGPALFRSIEKWQPTFVIDEADTVLVHNEDLKEVVNSGWTRGQCVIRCDPDTHEPRPYSTFAPKAIGMKGRKLPDTTLSRAIIVAIKRKRPDEMTADFDHLDTEDFARLRQQIARWARDNTDALARAEPESPVGFHNRIRANWRLLLAIAERVGGGWKLQAQRAARALEEVHDTFDPAIGIQLLADIRTAFEAVNTERMTSAAMIAELVKDEEGPWLEYGKTGKPITQKRLADLLKEFGIRPPHNVRPATGRQGKGYHRADFEDAWERYLPHGTVQTASQTVPPSHCKDFNGFRPEQTVPADFLGTDQNGANALKTKELDGGTLREGVSSVPKHIEAVEGARNASAGVVCREGDRANEGPHTCVQCNGPPDGKEKLCSVGGRSIWLHCECAPHYRRALEELEGLPW
jgi:putative DNA primase/helicase